MIFNVCLQSCQTFWNSWFYLSRKTRDGLLHVIVNQKRTRKRWAAYEEKGQQIEIYESLEASWRCPLH